MIEKNNRLYYDQDAPELEDFEKERVRERVEMPPLQILKKKGEKSIATRAHVWYYK